MFQAWLVKIAKIAAHSAPSTLPGNRPRKNVTVNDRKPRIGTDCRMSSTGISTISRPPALGRQRRIGEGEHQRGDQRGEHAQRRAQRVIGQVRIIERDRRLVGRRQGAPKCRDRRCAIAVSTAMIADERDQVPLVRQGPSSGGGEAVQHGRSPWAGKTNGRGCGRAVLDIGSDAEAIEIQSPARFKSPLEGWPADMTV